MSVVFMNAALLGYTLSGQITAKMTQAGGVRTTPIVFADNHGIMAQANLPPATVGFLALIGLIGAALVISAIRAGRREKQLARMANQLGFKFVPERDKTRMGHRFDHIHQLGYNKGSTSNHLIGKIGDWGVVACDHSYYSRTVRRSRFHDCGIVLIQIPHRMTEVIIEPKNWGDKLLAILGVKSVEFESRKFSRRFAVRAKDPSFAYDLLHPDAMALLLRHRRYSWEFDRHTVALYSQKRFKPRQLQKAIDAATEFIGLIPEHVWDETGGDAATDTERAPRTSRRITAVAPVERQADVTYPRVKRARNFAPIMLLFGLNLIWTAARDFAQTPETENLVPNLFRAAIGLVFIRLFLRFYRRLRAFGQQRRAAGHCAKAMYDERGRVDTSELARKTGCADESTARIHIQWAQRKGLLPSNAEVFSSGAIAVEGTCPKCYAVWEFSSIDRAKKTDCPTCMARFKVPDEAGAVAAVESCSLR